jgi:hypothetical protein
MRIRNIIFIAFALSSCKVTFVAGYDPIIEETITSMQKDFNLHFIKLGRVIQDNDPGNQEYSRFQDYYDNMNANLYVVKSRAKYLGKKGQLVSKQINNLDSTLHVFEGLHKKGIPDSPVDDRRDIRNGINSSFDAVIKLQEALKTKK